MKKNVIFLTSIKNKEHDEKYGGYEWMDISKKTWEYWCKKNDCILYVYDKPSEDNLFEYRVTWQRWFDVFKELDKNNIEFDKVFVIDSTSMVRWDCPNFFDLCDDRMVAWRDSSNLNWIYYSVQGYKDLMTESHNQSDFKLDISKYINCGSIIINESHREFLNSVKTFYEDYKNQLIELQDVKVKKGTDQTPFNYLLQMSGMDFNIDLPKSFNLNHMNRGDWFSHNWQDGDDKTPFFLKYSYIWRSTGIPKNDRSQLMSNIWSGIKHNYTFDENKILLNSVNHKDTFKNATSRKFKKDLLEFFDKDEFKKMSLVEFGSCHGDTTKIFCKLFKNVHAVDWRDSNIDIVKQKCKDYDNITYQVKDVSTEEWDFPKADVVFIDASHDYPQIDYDIEKAINYFNNPIIILDDYGNPNNRAIRNAIDKKISEGKLKINKLIGEDSGFKTKSGWEMCYREGVICNYEGQ